MQISVFRYRAKNLQGVTVEGEIEASDRNEVFRIVRQQQFFPFKIEEIKEPGIVKKGILFSKIKPVDLALFCRQFAAMINAGVPVGRCLDILKDQVPCRLLKYLLGEIYKDVSAGRTLFQAFSRQSKFFPHLFIYMIEAGEISGTLDVALERMAAHYEKESRLRQKITGALIYPAVVLVVAAVIVYFLLTNVVPVFVGIYARNGVELPAATRILIAASDVLKQWGVFIIAAVFGIAFLIKRACSSSRGRRLWHVFLLKMPVLRGVIIKIISARFSRVLGMLLSTGVPVIQALEVTQRMVGNAVAEEVLEKASEGVRLGANLSDALQRAGLFPLMVIQMIRVGEESGTVDVMLDRMASFYENEVETGVGRLVTLMEPAILIVLGGVVGFIVLSIATPLFNMVNVIK